MKLQRIISLILLVGLCLATRKHAYSQILMDTACAGDTICLVLSGYNGSIQWEGSVTGNNWYNISGANSDTICISADSTSYYRAVVVDGTCNPIYSDTSYLEVLGSAGADTFLFTGVVDTFIVPCVDSITVELRGAEGGSGPVGCNSNTFEVGGMGGRVQATFPVNAGDTLLIYVGGKGEDDNNTSAAGGWNGGGNALLESNYTYYGGGGGGGGSDIRTVNGTLNDRIIVAGGGGGAGADGCNCNDLYGGAGGGLVGGDGEQGVQCNCDPGGFGGTQAVGGAAGDWSCSCNAQSGSFGIGGNSNSTSCGGPQGAGGGGGGWYGGGGGGLGGGGGGSSYTFTSAVNVIHTQGFQLGDGIIIITW